jgi:hypothetical protein
MASYFIHLRGDIEAQDAHGHECSHDDEARAHGDFIAHRIGTEKPEMVKAGNCIAVVNSEGVELARLAIASTVSGPINPNA